ncbi:MAG: multicopper oxidase domain-containing protein, partial [Chloroflexi bacterium]|nr:multicopper oxidase domain-containing protein [Chloroflexota bacterium]
MQHAESPQRNPDARRLTRGGSVRAIYLSMGGPPLVVLLGLAFIALLSACGGRPTPLATQPSATATNAPPTQIHTPGPTPPPSPTNTTSPTQSPTPGGHQGSEGLVLGSDSGQETVYPGVLCNSSVPVREYDLVAVNIEITLNRFLDYDPVGRMYVLEEDLERARREESQNLQARLDNAEPAVSIGLQGDAIQPMTLRVNQGECLRLTLRNGMSDGEPVSLHLHGTGLHLADTGTPAIATNPEAIAQSGVSVTYEWMVEKDEPEGTHYFHSHGDDRLQTSHGLFGALIVEPAGSLYLDPLGGGDLRSGWAAIIQDPNGSNFREFAIFYHEIGNERFRNLNRLGRQVPFVDTLTGAYKPGGRAMNYRSEPFMNRLKLQADQGVKHDASQAYSSYTFGDPATPIARTYLGDPVKQRVVHGGSEVFHVHHVHGGATRWRRQPGVEPTAFDSGFDKNPPLLPQASARTDSQSIGPSESYDLENECGAGGCQHSVGDYLIHCHVAHHYIAGMWMIWRVYNTLQDGVVSQDTLPPLAELPGRTGGVQAAVTSVELVDTTVDWKGQTLQISQENLAEWVERQLPPSGVPKEYDASVMDWRKEGDLYLNEVETEEAWQGYVSPEPGTRPPLYFNPATGKLAYPFLRPHLASRPPFAPNHGPAPFLEPFRTGTGPAQPGENGPWSLCPKGAKVQEFVIHAINLPITLSRSARIVDPVGQLYVLKEEEDAVRANNGLKNPLAIRANAGEDCVDILFKSELEDTGENSFFSKANIHVHFVQFDVQGSDGVNTGFNYETSVRPFTVEGEKLVADAAAGDGGVKLGNAGRFQPGALVGVGMDQSETFEVRRIRSIDGNTLVFDEPLRYGHKRREIVSYEFVRYRWYPDVQFGTAYFHDHVSALTSWKHGLFGALISEPPGSTYRSSRTGEEVRSGPLVDIHTDGKVSADISGSFREMVLFIQDENTLTKTGRSAGSSFNLRVAPLEARAGDPSLLFSSQAHGDPETPLLEAYLGDPLVIRGLVAATNDVHTLHVDGHWFRVEPYSTTSPPVSTVHIGISERYDLSIAKAGGPQRMPGDYLYYNGRSFKLREGSWGIIRVHDGDAEVRLQKLPGHQQTPQAAESVCPSEAISKEFSVAAIEAALPMLGEEKGRIYVLVEDKEAVLSGARPAEPLVLHVNVGDCIRVSLSNETTGGPVSFHADMLSYDPAQSMGIAAGANPIQTVAPGEARTYTFYAHPEVGETVALVRDWGNVLENPGLGLYGAVIVGPAGAKYTDPVTGEDAAMKSSWRVDVHPPSRPAYRDFSLFIQDEDEVIGTHIMPYSQEVEGVLGLNYRLEPLGERLTQDKNPSRVFDSRVHGDPATPIIEAMAGDRVAIHVLVPSSEQAHVFTLEGHQWPVEPGRKGSDLVSSLQVGALEAVTLVPEWGAGGREGLPGDYLYGDHREPYR